MNKKIKLAYLTILSGKLSMVNNMPHEEYIETFNWISGFDTNKNNIPWWFVGSISINKRGY